MPMQFPWNQRWQQSQSSRNCFVFVEPLRPHGHAVSSPSSSGTPFSFTFTVIFVGILRRNTLWCSMLAWIVLHTFPIKSIAKFLNEPSTGACLRLPAGLSRGSVQGALMDESIEVTDELIKLTMMSATRIAKVVTATYGTRFTDAGVS